LIIIIIIVLPFSGTSSIERLGLTPVSVSERRSPPPAAVRAPHGGQVVIAAGPRELRARHVADE
jgi:hypothetical protein